MLFKILEIADDNSAGVVEYNQQRLRVKFADIGTDEAQVGKYVYCEIEWSNLLSWATIPNFQLEMSGIWQAANGIRVAGKVVSIMQLDDSEELAEVAILDDPVKDLKIIEIRAKEVAYLITTSELGDNLPPVGTGLEILIDTLILYSEHFPGV